LTLLPGQPATAQGDAPPRTDLYGDALPPGAIARLGTMRWRQSSGVTCVAFSPDGKLLAAGSGVKDGSIYLWEVATGKVRRRLQGHTHEVQTIAFSSDGKRLASCSVDSTIRLWSVATGQELWRFGEQGNACLAFSPDGKILATATVRFRPVPGLGERGRGRRIGDTTIRLWDTASGKEVRRLELPRSIINALAFAPDGKTLVSGQADGLTAADEEFARAGGKPEGPPSPAVRLWEVATGKERQTFWEPAPAVRSLAFSPDGKVLATGCDDKTIRLWQMANGRQLHRLDAGARPGRDPDQLRQLGTTVRVLFSPDGKTLLSACEDRTMLVWDALTGKLVRQLPDRGYPVSLALSPDGKQFAVGGSSGRTMVSLLQTATGEPVSTTVGHLGGVHSLAFAPDGKTLATAAWDIHLWDAPTGKHRRRLDGGLVVAYSPDGKVLACGSSDYTLRLRDAITGRELHRLRAARQGVTHPWVAAFSPDGKFLASEAQGSFGLWDVATGEARPKPDQLARERTQDWLRAQLNSVAFSPDGKTLAWAAEHTELRLWPLTPDKPYHRLPQVGVRGVAFSPDGKLLASAGGRPLREKATLSLLLWDPVTGREQRRFPDDPGNIQAVAFSPDGKTVATGGRDGMVRLWEVVTGKERQRFEGHRGPIHCVAFAPDGSILASGSADTTVLLWDLTGLRK